MEKLATTGLAPVNGLQMYYEVHGSGSMPLVLIHGGGSTIESAFGKLLPILALRHKVIAVELQAHGRTSDRDAPESFVQDADDVAALLKYLSITKADILGFSNGGSTALQIAIRHPEIVNRLIAISAAFKRDGFLTGLFDHLQHATISDMPERLKEDFLKVTPDKDKLQNMFEKDKARMLNFKDWPEEDISSIKAPALIMASDKDVITVEHTTEIARLIRGAQLIILPGIHGVMIGEAGAVKPGSRLHEITADLIGDFLNE